MVVVVGVDDRRSDVEVWSNSRDVGSTRERLRLVVVVRRVLQLVEELLLVGVGEWSFNLEMEIRGGGDETVVVGVKPCTTAMAPNGNNNVDDVQRKETRRRNKKEVALLGTNT